MYGSVTSNSGPRGSLAGIGSLAGLVLLVAGCPILLMRAGVGIYWHGISRALEDPHSALVVVTQHLSDNGVAGLAVAIAWVAWLWLVACVVTEVTAAIRGIRPRSLPCSRTLQAVVAVMVATSVTLLALPRADPGPQSNSTIELVVDAAAPAGSVLLTAPTQPPVEVGGPSNAATGVSAPAYVVQRGDSLWSIAEEHLGSPLRWPEIADINRGVRQPDGFALEAANWLLPGWQLELPRLTAASASPTLGADSSAPVSPPVIIPTPMATQPPVSTPGSIVAGTSAAQPAQSSQTAQPTPSIATATSTPADSSSLTTTPTPEIPAPGMTVPPPTPTGKAAGASMTPVTRNLQTSSVRDATGSQGAFAAHGDHGSNGSSGSHHNHDIPIGIGVGVLSVGLIGVLENMRRAQRRRRPSGMRVRLPDGDVALLERRLRFSADVDSVDWIDVALRLLTAQSRRSATPVPRVLAITIDSDALELRLDASNPTASLQAPFVSADVPGSWRLPRLAEVLSVLQDDPWVVGMDPPTPALVSVGSTQSGPLLLNLECAGSLRVVGPRAAELVRAMVLELAASRWSGQLDMVLVGHGDELTDLERVESAGSLAEILPIIRHRAREQADLLASVQQSSVSDARIACGGDAWDMVGLFVTDEAMAANPAAARELVEIVGDGASGVVLVVEGSHVATRWLVDVTREPVVLEAAGMQEMVWPQFVDQGTLEEITVLFDVARDMDGVDVTAPPYDRIEIDVLGEIPNPPTHTSRPTAAGGVGGFVGDLPISDSSSVVGRAPTLHPEREVQVKILGPVEVTGAAKPFSRAWAFDLVAYLAMHPRGATTEQWATALWPDRLMAPASLHSTASAARRCLGTSSSGIDHLPRSHGRLALHDSVGTDWEIFVALGRSANTDDWGAALDLVRGRPFEGLRSSDWALLEGIVATVEADVVDLAMRYAQVCLEAGASSDAERAARQALRVSPYDERLYRVLLRAADLAGNPAGVESVMAELVYLVADGVEPFDAVHPETLDLYRSLSRRPVSASRR